MTDSTHNNTSQRPLARLDIRGLCHRHQAAQNNPLHDINFRVDEGQIHFLLGPSGSGKTTLLRLIAGLECLQDGEIFIHGISSGHLAPDKRKIGLVFQDHALFPNLTARENIAFGLRLRSFATQLLKPEQTLVDAMIMRFGLEAVAKQYPHQLSGGQQQRVGIARAIIAKPAIVLFDEPFSSLDGRTKEQTRDDILHLLNAIRSSALIVSHDPTDAMHMANHITILGPDGRIAQDGSPEEIFYHPNSVFVARFMSEVNCVPGVFGTEGFKTVFGTFPAHEVGRFGDQGIMTVRPEGMQLLPSDENELAPGRAQVIAARVLGSSSLIHLRSLTENSAEVHLHVRQPGVYIPAPGSIHRIIIDPKMAFVFAESPSN
ncbi:MAG: ABC transporter ATP-binding protein [Alphaproteobacteria bacterium]|nr:ABC transporter ATP-binding protein [Alphaproteobacteria bacterium]